MTDFIELIYSVWGNLLECIDPLEERLLTIFSTNSRGRYLLLEMRFNVRFIIRNEIREIT